MSFKLSTPKPLINHPNISEKCSSYGVRKDQNKNYKNLSQKPKSNHQKFSTEKTKILSTSNSQVLKLESITQSNNKNNLQIKLHDAVVKEPEKRKHLRKKFNKLL